MMTDSKIFVGLRPTRGKQAKDSAPAGPTCQWDGCGKPGTHRAPVGRDAVGLYLMFCTAHAREYNKGYNFASDQSDPVVARYQREAASGTRRTWGEVHSEPSEIPLPSKERSGTAKAFNARRNAAERQAMKREVQRRRLKVLEAKAFETLGLPEDATSDEIRRQYKLKLKMHHPDANDGDRNSEDELRASIDAYKILRLNGFC